MNNPSFETQHLEEYALRLVLDNLKEVSYDVSKFDKPRSHHARHSHFESSTIEYSHPLIWRPPPSSSGITMGTPHHHRLLTLKHN